jgi:SAM-dependent methyltransferase
VIPVSARAGYDLWAETWDSTPSPIVAVEERALTPWLKRLRPGSPAIDIGCGTGRWTARLNALGFDASPAMLAAAARKPGLRGRIAAAEATALPLASGSADMALCTLTLGHIRNSAAAMREFARVLRPDGILILTDFHPVAAARGWRRTFAHDGETYEIENYPYDLNALAGAAPGLSLIETAEATIGEPERALFETAGRMDLFTEACQQPAVLLSLWTRR